MKPEEYRIGNLLRDKLSKTELKVIELTEENIITYVLDRSKYPLKDGWGLEPIPLTEQWLLDFGFIVDREWEEITNPDEGDESKIKFHKVFKYELKGWLNRVIYFIVERGVIYCYVTPRHLTDVKYVHQFQNLYYSITGEELKRQK